MQCNNLFLFKTNSPCPRFSVVEDTVSNFSHGYKQNIQSACSKTNNPPPPPSASLPPSVTRGDVTDIQPMAAAQTPARTALASVMEVCVCVWEHGCGKIN